MQKITCSQHITSAKTELTSGFQGLFKSPGSSVGCCLLLAEHSNTTRGKQNQKSIWGGGGSAASAAVKLAYAPWRGCSFTTWKDDVNSADCPPPPPPSNPPIFPPLIWSLVVNVHPCRGACAVRVSWRRGWRKHASPHKFYIDNKNPNMMLKSDIHSMCVMVCHGHGNVILQIVMIWVFDKIPAKTIEIGEKQTNLYYRCVKYIGHGCGHR